MSSFTFSASALQFTDCSKFPTLSFKCQKHVIISRNVKLGSRILPALKSSDQEMENEDSSEIANGPSTSFLSLLCPLLKLFSGGDPSSKRNYLLEEKTNKERELIDSFSNRLSETAWRREATSTLSTLARLPWGSRVQYGTLGSKDGTTLNPPMHLQIFEFEACPFCRRVREAMTELDLSAEIYPCPKGSVRHREMVRRLGGKEQFPFLVDPNTGTSLYESGAIVKYLFHQYGQGRNPSTGLLERSTWELAEELPVPVNQVPNMQGLADNLGCLVAFLPNKYLGMPLGAKTKELEVWGEVLERSERKLTRWKSQYLSLGGRVTLIKSVLDALPTYMLSLFPLPKSIGKKLNKLRRVFL